jgi:hypothetical protein
MLHYTSQAACIERKYFFKKNNVVYTTLQLRLLAMLTSSFLHIYVMATRKVCYLFFLWKLNRNVFVPRNKKQNKG